MQIPAPVRRAPLALILVAVAINGSLRAQDPTPQPPTVQLAFGYECGDRFIVRNDGTQPVTVEYKASGSEDRAQLHVNAKQSAEIASASASPLELWVNGKLVATEAKGNRACGAAASTPDVVVRPIEFGAPGDAAPGIPPSRVARLSSITGNVSFEPSGATDWSAATLNYTVTTGDRLYSDQNGRAELEVGPFAVRMAGGADLTVSALTDGLSQLALQQGAIRLAVYRLTPSDTIEVDTPNGALLVLAPGAYFIETSPGGGATLVSVDQGRVEATGPGLSQVVGAGRAVRLSGANPIQLSSVPRPALTNFDQWCLDRDRRLTSASAPYVSPDIPGRADLDAYGTWEVDAAIGPVWYPRAVAVGWVPYRFGHWAWVEPWGWIWVEDEPWGFAPFHYGRWANGPRGWGWVPGPIVARPYYAPALVAWVDAPRGGFGVTIGVQAWFPLGPREPFFPWYHHDERYLRQVNATNINVTNINTVIHVTNVENVQYVHRRTAVTVVPAEAFAAGRPVAREAIPVNVNRMAQGRIAAHATAAPTVQAAAGGSPVPRPPNAIERRPMNNAGGSIRAGVPVGGAPQPSAQAGSPRGAPAGATPAAVLPPGARVGGSPAGARAGGSPPGTPAGGPPPGTPAGVQPVRAPQPISPPMVSRHDPPPQNLPFAARQDALRAHPGRPLDPRQIANLRAGKPAGPPTDSELPPHKKAEPDKPDKKGKPGRPKE